MDETFDVSVVISTYNRCDMLPRALESVLVQDEPDVRYEVLIVDNNSTDQTRQVVESFIANGYSNLRYLFEGRQGLSYGRNLGIANARAPIIAFTDDDVRVARNWIAAIKRAFDEHPEVDCIGGKVLPRWEEEPPRWLTREHWMPLALLDYGKGPLYINSINRKGLVGANLSLRRKVFERIGLFAPNLQRVKDSIGSMEDHELLLRLWGAKGQCLYLPELVVTAEVTADRLKKAYHRKWHKGHGAFYAVLRSQDMEQSNRGRLFDVPAHLYKQCFDDAIEWLKCMLAGNYNRAFFFENRVRFFRGFFAKRRKDFLAIEGRSTTRELASLLRSIKLKKSSSAALKEID